MYSFLSALLLPRLPSAALPSPGFNFLTGRWAAAAAAAALTFSSSFFLLRRLLLFFFFILLPTSPGSVKGCLWEWVSWGQIPHRAQDKPPPMAQRQPGRGVQAEDRGHRSAAEQEKTTLAPRGRSCAIRQPFGLRSRVLVRVWFSRLSGVLIQRQHLLNQLRILAPLERVTRDTGSPGSDNAASLHSLVNKSIHTHTHAPV